jgi:predicted PurR-regulated permease PerM
MIKSTPITHIRLLWLRYDQGEPTLTVSTDTSSSPDWSPRTKRTVAIGAIFVGFIALWLLRDILPLLIVSTLIAYILNPMVTFLSTKILRLPFIPVRTRRGLATFIAFILVLMFIIVGILVIVPLLIDQIEEFGRSIPALLSSVERDLERILSEPLTFNGEPIILEGEPIIPLDRIAEATGTSDLSSVIQLSSIDLTAALETFLGSVGSLTGSAFSFFGGAFNTVINITFLLMLTFYLLKDSDLFVDYILRIAPPNYESDAKRLSKALRGRVERLYSGTTHPLCGHRLCGLFRRTHFRRTQRAHFGFTGGYP